MTKFRSMLVTAVLFFVATSANALMVNVTATADNDFSGGLCDDSSCVTGISWDAVTPTPNGNWQNPQTWALDLGAGTHWFRFNVINSGASGSGNPAGLLAEITWAGGTNSSSRAWEVNAGPGTWVAATEWAQNGTGIWGSARPGISTNAYWIYGDENFTAQTPANQSIRTSISIGALPEPGTLALLMIGLAGLVSVRRRA